MLDPMTSHLILRRAAAQLRLAAAILDGIVATRGDIGGAVGSATRDYRDTAREVEALAKELTPTPALVKMESGHAEAMKHFRSPLGETTTKVVK